MYEIITGVTAQLRKVSNNVYLNYLPETDFLKDHSIIFNINNPEKNSVGENSEAINFYELNVRVNSRQLTSLNYSNESESVLKMIQPIKSSLRKLNVSSIKCVSESYNYDEPNQINTYMLIYQIQN